MATPISMRSTNKRYLGNNGLIRVGVYDLHNERIYSRIGKIFWTRDAVVFEPDTLKQAHKEGYRNCG